MLCLVAICPILLVMGIDWIQYDERAVGENSPLYDDVVNRPTKQLYALYTSEHNPDGTHKLRALTTHTYALRGDGSGIMAEGVLPWYNWEGYNDVIIAAQVMLNSDDESGGSIYKKLTETGNTQFDFGITADWKLYLTLGSNTYASNIGILGDWGLSTIGVVCHASTVTFFNGGETEEVTVTKSFYMEFAPETHVIGENFFGGIFRIGVGDSNKFAFPFTFSGIRR